jgi:hypothetical protein
MISAMWSAAAESIESNHRKSASTRKPGGDILHKLTHSLRSELCLLSRNPLSGADHQEAFRSIEFNGIHSS